jgi:hypothetical protein
MSADLPRTPISRISAKVDPVTAQCAPPQLLDVAMFAAGIEEHLHRANDDPASSTTSTMICIPLPDAERASQRAAFPTVQGDQERVLTAALATVLGPSQHGMVQRARP